MERRKRPSKARKNVKHYSWHFWFLHILTLLAMLMGYSTGLETDKPITSGILFGVLIYLSPLFLSVIRNMMPRSLMLKFYKKSF